MVAIAKKGIVSKDRKKRTTAWYPRFVDFRKTYYVLPNLFTLSCVLSGFASLALSASGDSEANLYLAALAICFGLLFDTFDGRVARLTKTQTDLGRDLDSLADVITFGAAPALMMYKWGLNHFGLLGIFMAGIFVCAGAMRLARFNVLSRRDQASGKVKPGKYMLGLPIPAAASVLVFMVIVSHNAGSYQLVSEGSTALIVLVLSTLMVSRVRFRSFKELRLNLKTVGILLLVVGACVAIVVAGLEKALGLAEEVIFFRRRRAQERSESQTPAPDSAPAQEEDVLRELGAFDGEDEEPEPVKDPVTGPHHA
jgi:CDP-diacylglycerol--serine O-phosphatidyltransferase